MYMIHVIYVYSPGLRPNGVSGSLLDGLTVKGSYFQLFQGTPPTQQLHTSEYAKSLWRHCGAPRLIVMECWIACFASPFQSMFASCVDRFGPNVGTMLVVVRFIFRPSILHRFCIDFSKFGTSELQTVWFYYWNVIRFAKSLFREQVHLFIHFSIILAPFPDDSAIIFRYLFRHRFWYRFLNRFSRSPNGPLGPHIGTRRLQKPPTALTQTARFGDEGATWRWKLSKHHSHRFW